MVDKDVSKEGQLGIFRRNFTCIGAKRCAKAPQSGRGGELGDFVLCLSRNELTLEVCKFI
jgi:hypothetical protein